MKTNGYLMCLVMAGMGALIAMCWDSEDMAVFLVSKIFAVCVMLVTVGKGMEWKERGLIGSEE